MTFTIGTDLASPPAHARSGGSGGGFRSSSRSGSGGSRPSSRPSSSYRPSSSSSSSSYRPGSSSSSGSGSASGGGYSSGGYAPGYSSPYVAGAFSMRTILGLLFIIFVVFLIVRAVKKSGAAKAGRLAVARVQLAFDATRAKGLREAIEALVRSSDPTTSVGLWNLSQRVVAAIEPHLDAVTYAGSLAKDKLSDALGEAEFNALTAQARAFYDREVVRKDASGLAETERNSAKANALTDEDGDFGIDEFFVVTLVMAASGGPIALPPMLGIDEVQAAVAALKGVTLSRHSGFEVIWTPAAESDILGRDELLVAFPELTPL